MKYRLFVVFAFLIPLALAADEKRVPLFECGVQDAQATPLFAPKESSFLPQFPKVNLITGEYCEEDCDLVVAGAEPLSIRRFYNTGTGWQDHLYGHWRINPETLMFFNFEGTHGFQTLGAVGERNSSIFLYEKPITNGFVMDAGKSKGLTNTSSGQHHPLNTRISYTRGSAFYNKIPHYWWNGTITDGSGGERTFKTDVRRWPVGNVWPYDVDWDHRSREETYTDLEFQPPYQALITEERRPNGNIIRYEYKDRSPRVQTLPTHYALTSIKAYSEKGFLLGSIDIDYVGYTPKGYLGSPDKVSFKGSDGRTVSFTTMKRPIPQNRGTTDTSLAQVIAPGKPVLSYVHTDSKGDRSFPSLLCQVSQPEGRIFETTYNGWRRQVASQTAPVGPKGERVPVARYAYNSDHTIVYDGENNKTLYRYNGDKRITAIEKYQGEALYSIERNEWDPKNGNLLKKRIEDAKGTLFYTAEYIYDKNHNVIEERVEGASPIFRTYSDDGFNLKLTESDRPNKETRYTYLPKTNLLTSEITRIHGAVAKRTFHFYDPEIGSVCVKTITDDGTTENPEDLSGVTFRHIIEISPKRSMPCIGLPEEVREYAGDHLLKKVRYTYHPSGKIASEEHDDCYTLYNEYDVQERLIATTDALGNRTTFTYDSNYNLISQSGPRSDQRKEWSYDLANRPIKEFEWQSDGTILISEQNYDKASRLIATIDPSGFETRYTYDSLGRVTSICHPDGAIERKEYDIIGNIIQEIDPKGYVTRKTYNFRGQPTAIYHPDGTEEHFTYNAIGGTLAAHTDRHGVKTLYTYDLFDNLIRTETPSAVTTATYSPFRLLSETDPDGVTTTITYDLAGRKISERKGKKETFYSYNALGQLYRTQEGDVITLFSYDLKGQLIEKRIEGFFRENYTYDEAGNQITRTTCGGTFHTFYNSRGEPIRAVDPLGNTSEIAYSYSGGFSKTVRDPHGIAKVFLHDSRKRLIDLLTKNSRGEVIQREERKYDLSGNQTEAIEYLYEGATFRKTVSRTWSYGPLGRLERLIEAGEKETRYLYDNQGRLATLVKPDGNEIHRSYDAQSRLARYFGRGVDYTYTYDAKNRLIKIDDGIRKTALVCTYDIYDNMTSERLDSGLTIRRDYDPYGRCIALHLPDATSVIYTYRGPYLHTISRSGLTYTYAMRNLAGRPTEILLPYDFGAITIEWDPLLRWKTYNTTQFRASYAYDAVGNLTTYNFTDHLGTEEVHYGYDDLRQLTKESGHNYSYDSLFNRRSKDQQNYTLNNLFQITHDGQTNYTYDKNGSLLSDGNCTYEYDLLDRLVAVTSNGERTTYTYDALNRRVAKGDDLYLWDGQQEIGMMRYGSVQELRILGEGRNAEIGAAVMIELQKGIYIPIHDHRGSLVSLLTQWGKPHSIYRYTAFGECTQHFVTVGLMNLPYYKERFSPWCFCSKRSDPESGLIYFGRRYYAPLLGRWITTDPQGFQDGPNLYAYVHNNPLLYCDPYGLYAKSFRETRNAGEACGRLFYCAFRSVEKFGHHCIPIPGVRDIVEATGRWARGGNLFKPRERATIIESNGGRVIDNTVGSQHNGINTSLDSFQAQVDKLSEEHDGLKIHGYYTPSHGVACDLITSLLAKCGIKSALDKRDAEHIARQLQENPQLQIRCFAHSYGCTRLYNTGTLLNDEQCSRIEVFAFGGATLFSQGRFKEVHNYVSKFDIVPMTSAWNYVKCAAGVDSNVTFLKPNSWNPLTEHGFLENTYRRQLEDLGRDFKEEHPHE